MAYQGIDPVCFEGVSAVTATNSVELGTKRIVDGEEYVYVYAVGAVSQAVGCTISGVSGYSVCATGIISGTYCMGFVKHAEIPAGSYGWLLQRGFVNSVVNGMASTALAATDNVQLAADGKICAAGAGGHCLGRMITAAVSGGTGGSNTGKIFVSVA
jgi:hypothetical protein